MRDLAKTVECAQISKGGVAFWWLAQAGFVFKSSAGTIIYVDAYLSNVVERLFGFKRLSLAPIETEEVRADWVVSSHEHLDHLDTDALPIIARNNPDCRFAGPSSCLPEYVHCGIGAERQVVLKPGKTYTLGDVKLHTTQADHGELSPSALSLLLNFGATRVLFTGDTALRIAMMQPLIDLKPDVLLPCINGKYGNFNPTEAAQLTYAVNPRLVIPCHFWMFKEHNGDPEAFVQACSEICPGVPVTLLTPGDGMLVTQDSLQPLP